MRKYLLCCGFVLLLQMFTGHVSTAAWDDPWQTIDIHGFISQGFLQSDRNNFYADTEDGTFQFNEFGLNVSADVTDRLYAGLQLLSRDLGAIGNNTVELDWAQATYRWKDWLYLQAGCIKTPWGLYNETRDIDLLRTSIFLPPSLYSEDMRDAYNSYCGIGFGGNLSLRSFGSLDYQIGFGEKDVSPDSGTARGDDDYSLGAIETTELTIQNIIGGAVTWNTPLEGLRLRLTLGTYDGHWEGRYTDQFRDYIESLDPDIELEPEITEDWENTTYRIFSAEYTWNNLVLAAEYSYDSDKVEGYYGKAAYRFSDWFELGGYYSASYPDKTDRNGEDLEAETGLPKYKAWQKEFVLTTRFDLNESWVFKLEGHFINGAAEILLSDNPDGLQEDSFLFAAKMTFSF